MSDQRLWCFALLLFSLHTGADIHVEDDLGREIILSKPAQRVISLAPHLTEVVYAVGGGDRMVATVAWSDFPEEAKLLPIIGSNNKINYEALLAYNPDLVLVWRSGNGESIIQRLSSLGLNVFVNEPKKLNSIPDTLHKIGRLLGVESESEKTILEFQLTLSTLQNKYQQVRKVSVYYQIWQSPLISFGGKHLVSDVLRLCGAENIFSDVRPLVPRIGVESVLAADPEVIIVGQYTDVDAAFEYWKQWPQLKAVTNHHLYKVDPYLLHRHTPRILLGAKQLCSAIDQAR
ncbi:MAG: cobalamin-binding protein [Porticoccus sp.]|nr:cobalamin-binding protein [Porticoccus sp.]